MQSIKKYGLLGILLGMLGHDLHMCAAYRGSSWGSFWTGFDDMRPNEQFFVADQRLFQAAEKGDVEGVREALAIGANAVDRRNTDGATALHLTKDITVAELLIKAKAHVDIRDDHGITPLNRHKNDANMVELLIFHKARVEVLNTEDRTILHGCTSCESIDMLLRVGARIDTMDSSGTGGNTVLHSTDIGEHVLKHLIARGAGKWGAINRGNDNGNRPLHFASTGPIAQLLIDNNAYASERNKQGSTALHKAPCREVVQVLLKAEPLLLEAKNKKGQTPLHCASVGAVTEVGKREVVDELLARGADVDAKDKRKRSALQMVAEQVDIRVSKEEYKPILTQLIRAWASPFDMSKLHSIELKTFIEQTFEEREKKWAALWHSGGGPGVLRAGVDVMRPEMPDALTLMIDEYVALPPVPVLGYVAVPVVAEDGRSAKRAKIE